MEKNITETQYIIPLEGLYFIKYFLNSYFGDIRKMRVLIFVKWKISGSRYDISAAGIMFSQPENLKLKYPADFGWDYCNLELVPEFEQKIIHIYFSVEQKNSNISISSLFHEQFAMQVLQMELFLPLLHCFLHPSAPSLQYLHLSQRPLQQQNTMLRFNFIQFEQNS